jgi:hypothetical protein
VILVDFGAIAFGAKVDRDHVDRGLKERDLLLNSVVASVGSEFFSQPAID